MGIARAQPAEGTEIADGAAMRSPRWQQVTLALDVDARVAGCPSLEEFSAWVDQLVGRTFVVPAAAARLSVEVRPALSGELVAELSLLAEPAPQLLRQLRDRLDCEGLLRAVALSVSLLAKPATPLEAAPVPAEAPPRSEPSAPAAGGPPSAPTEPVEPPVAPPAPAAPIARAAPPSAARPSQHPPHADAVASSADWSLAGFGLVAMGQNPGVGLGGGLEARAYFGFWSVTGGGAYLASTGTEAADGEGSVRAVGPTAEAKLAGCRQSEPPVWSACLQLGYWWMFARGDRFDHDLSEVVRTPAVGALLGGIWASGDAWQLASRIEAFVPLQRVKLEAEGLPEPVWNMWLIVPRAAVSFEWK